MGQANVLFLSKPYFLLDKPREMPLLSIDALLLLCWHNELRDTKTASTNHG